MQIEQRFTLPLPPAQAWPAFHDIALLVECLPGASLAGEVQGGEVPLRFDVKLGPIAAGFVGAGKVTFDEAERAGRFEGNAADRKTNSRVKGAADFTLAEAADGGTEVTVQVDYTLSGTLAQFGRAGIVRELANALTAQFAANLQARLQAALPPAEPAGPAEVLAGATNPSASAAASGSGPATAARVAPAVPMSLGTLLLQVLRTRWAGLVQSLSPGRRR